MSGDDMDTIPWETDATYPDCLGNHIRLLRRSLPDVESAKSKELLPFFHETSSFVLESFVPERDKERVRGKLLRLDLEPSVARACILSHRHTDEYLWLIHAVARTLLTVWRLNDLLEAVQVELEGRRSVLHMQMGGEHLLCLFDNQGRGVGWCEELATEARAFSENTVWPRGNGRERAR
ncbi:MAG TPA: hypothetical protein VM238_02600 [Phycisphaerae bacterium]|nr:hypothetical protein [Phycisphaerae bacterium]